MKDGAEAVPVHVSKREMTDLKYMDIFHFTVNKPYLRELVEPQDWPHSEI